MLLPNSRRASQIIFPKRPLTGFINYGQEQLPQGRTSPEKDLVMTLHYSLASQLARLRARLVWSRPEETQVNLVAPEEVADRLFDLPAKRASRLKDPFCSKVRIRRLELGVGALLSYT